jgi:putative membrane protein
MYPAMMTVIGSGTGLIMYYGWEWFINSYWLHAKLAAVSALLVYHFWLGWIITQFRSHKQPYSETFFRVINEVPTVLLILIICLVKIKSLY